MPPVTDPADPSFTGVMETSGPAASGRVGGIDELDDREIERLLAGTGSPGPAWGEVADVLDRLRGQPTIAVSDSWVRHYVAVTATTAHDDITTPVPTAGRRGRRLRVGVVVAATTIVGTVGLSAADTLPGPLQGAAARVAALVGVELPDGNDRGPGKGPETSPASPVRDAPAGAPTDDPTTARRPGDPDPSDGEGERRRPGGGSPSSTASQPGSATRSNDGGATSTSSARAPESSAKQEPSSTSAGPSASSGSTTGKEPSADKEPAAGKEAVAGTGNGNARAKSAENESGKAGKAPKS